MMRDILYEPFGLKLTQCFPDGYPGHPEKFRRFNPIQLLIVRELAVVNGGSQ